jgi:serine/threonine protein phosphatase 1
MTNLIKHFAKNTNGKDYVVGDIHGMFKKLYVLLDNIGFDFKNDRLFSVGDLCDRGPDSPDVLHWLQCPWFFPVMGNHEEVILLYEANRLDDSALRSIGASWWLAVDKKTKQDIVHAYQHLPIAIEVETNSGLVGIIHAHCPHIDWNKLKDLFSGVNKGKMINKALWSMESPLQNDIIQNVKAVVVGHMTQPNYTINGNVHLIDTGACYPQGHFTILELETMNEMKEFN